MPIESFLFDTHEGRPVEGFTLSAGGLEATVIAHGARLVRMLVPGRDGTSAERGERVRTLMTWSVCRASSPGGGRASCPAGSSSGWPSRPRSRSARSC